MDNSPIRIADLISLRLSLASTKHLSTGQSERLIDELERLLRERADVVALLEQLRSGPWPETRRILGELQRALGES